MWDKLKHLFGINSPKPTQITPIASSSSNQQRLSTFIVKSKKTVQKEGN
jgi:hypothetical protein